MENGIGAACGGRLVPLVKLTTMKNLNNFGQQACSSNHLNGELIKLCASCWRNKKGLFSTAEEDWWFRHVEINAVEGYCNCMFGQRQKVCFPEISTPRHFQTRRKGFSDHTTDGGTLSRYISRNVSIIFVYLAGFGTNWTRLFDKM